MLNNTEKNAILHKIVWKASERGKILLERIFKLWVNHCQRAPFPSPAHSTAVWLPLSPLHWNPKISNDGIGGSPLEPLWTPVSSDLSAYLVQWIPPFLIIFLALAPTQLYIFSLFIPQSPSQGPLSLLSFFSFDTVFLGNYIVHFHSLDYCLNA